MSGDPSASVSTPRSRASTIRTGEGARACLTVYREQAQAAAEAADARARDGISLGPLDGTIVTIKDLFDVAGEVTRAGSKVLADEGKPAERDAPVVQRLRAAGAVIVAKTNMSEFAFTGIGINPHYGTPGNPADRARVPGGSSSGAAVAVADGMCEIAIGSDTGGSVPHSGGAVRRHRLQAEPPAHSDRGRVSACPIRSIPSARWRRASPIAPMPTR